MDRLLAVSRRARRRATRALLGAAVLAAASLAAGSASASAAAFEWDGVAVGAVNPGLIATDGAGRVIVPLPGQGRVAIFDNARGGNAFIRTIGDGVLVDPYAVAIDDREDIYVADRGLHAVVVFDALYNNSGLYRVNGSRGTALVQFDEPRGITVDSLTRAYVVEQGNLRAQVLEVAGTELRVGFAFGLFDPLTIAMSSPDGIALDSLGRYLVSDNSAGGVVGFYDQRGAALGVAVGPGAGAGQVDRPRGMHVDLVDRVIVADSGNNRVSLFNPAAAGFGHLASFGTAGAGVGQFNAPSAVALAPGALLYVADPGNSRIVRLRYDDADHDGAIDARDVCPGVTDPQQREHDGDGAGDACDLDDDGDGLPDSLDACPITLPLVDANHDGCPDPFSAATTPARGSSFERKPTRVAGTAKAEVLGVRRVWVAVARRSGARCSWLTRNRKHWRAGACNRPRYFRARGKERWSASLGDASFAPGRYVVYTRAQQKRSGMLERTKRVKTSFRVAR